MRGVHRELSINQHSWLLLVDGAGKAGYSASAAQPSLNALLRRGLVAAGHCRSSFDNRRWVATMSGRDWLAEERARMMAS